jgi:hypothetical protein
MKISIDPVIAGRIQAAWNALTPEQRAALAPAVLQANHQALSIAQNRMAPPGALAAHHLMLAQSALTNDADGVVGGLDEGVVISTGADGTMLGTGKYEQLDPGWLEAFAVFLENLAFGEKHPFIANPATVAIPDKVQIGLVGDWGTGNWRTAANPAPSTDVANKMATLHLDINIHLGDVYYAGTGDQEHHNFTQIWPKATIGSLALNSNHEMYSGAKPYFQAIGAAPFGMQNGCSYFALENSNWVIVGLDSAYFSSWAGLYMDGSLGPAGGTQVIFLQQQVAKGKKVAVLTHHNGLAEDGQSATGLWAEVMSGFPAGKGPALWYWGHAHAAAVYKAHGPAAVASRCCGHGGLPWAQAPALQNPMVEWYEHRSANDPDIPQRVLNGFAVLRLDGGNVQETFYDENGGVAWQKP